MRVAGVLRTRSRARSRLYFGAAIAALIATEVVASATRALFAFFAVAIAIGAAIHFSWSRQAGTLAPRSTAIEVFADDVDIGGVRVSKSAILSAHREDDRALIELRDGLHHELRASAAEAEALIEALGFGPGKRVRRIVVGGFAAAATQTMATIATAAMVLLAAPLLAALLFSLVGIATGHRQDEVTTALLLAVPAISTGALACKLWSSIRRVPIHVGGDGVRVGAKMFPFTRLEVARAERTVHLSAGVERVALRCRSVGEALSLVSSIEDARLGREPVEVDKAPLSRGGDDAEAWKSRLFGLVEADAYRARIGREDLARIAEDGSASAEARVGAALALSKLAPDAPERARVRLAIDAVASPSLRIALERAETGELDEHALAAEMRRRMDE